MKDMRILLFFSTLNFTRKIKWFYFILYCMLLQLQCLSHQIIQVKTINYRDMNYPLRVFMRRFQRTLQILNNVHKIKSKQKS